MTANWWGPKHDPDPVQKFLRVSPAALVLRQELTYRQLAAETGEDRYREQAEAKVIELRRMLGGAS